jgi:pyruvate dehydrogenase E2 component (dihydrolipoamide acetyltransferase)
MPREYRMPALGADMESGTVTEWNVGPGSKVKRGDVVAVVETDKGAIDVEIFEDGVIREIVVQPGTRVAVGTVLALLEDELGTSPPAPAPTPAPAPEPEPAHARARISPAARARARELGVDPAQAKGTGPDGAVTREDVEQLARAPASAGPVRPVAGSTAATESGSMREAIASAMARSKREIPHYYLSTTVDVTGATEWLAARSASVAVTERLIFPALLIRSMALASREIEGFSGFYREGRYERAPDVHVGVAVAIRGGGLVAPAIPSTADRTLVDLMALFRDLVARARAGRLRASELASPTIILTNLAEGEIEAVIPIIQPPQVAIVGAGAILERPWVVDGKLVPRQLLTLSLAADHRVTDGRLGARFLARIGELLKSPDGL